MHGKFDGLGRFADPSLLILTSLSDGPKHGYAIMADVAGFSGVRMEPGTLYGALSRLERRGWIAASWDVSDNNRKAKYYKLTATGRKQLERETDSWRRLVAAVGSILETA